MEKKNKKIKNTILALLIIILLGISIYNIWLMYKNIEISNEYEGVRTSLSTNYAKNVDNSTDNSTQAVNMLETVTKSVVGISKLSSTGGSILNNIKSDELGLGTGIIVSQDGYILSNSHVTGEKYSNCYVTVDENTYEGSVKWSDTNLDLSIVKIVANDLDYASLGDSSSIKVGESVYAVGNPIGYEFRKTVTSGIISALNRTIKIDENDSTSYISDLIQTDATINPGNSGGPLVNERGEVIGINTVKITSAEGIGFAVPINVVKPVINSFRQNGNFEEATLGIYAYDGDVANYLNLKSKLNRGVYVSKVISNGPAAGSDLKEGDLICSVNGKNLNTINDLREFVYGKVPGVEVELEVIRGESRKNIKIALGRKN
ncbi:MAG: S1C family serine protease [Clostridia bacterium]